MAYVYFVHGTNCVLFKLLFYLVAASALFDILILLLIVTPPID